MANHILCKPLHNGLRTPSQRPKRGKMAELHLLFQIFSQCIGASLGPTGVVQGHTQIVCLDGVSGRFSSDMGRGSGRTANQRGGSPHFSTIESGGSRVKATFRLGGVGGPQMGVSGPPCYTCSQG